jgi:hypothetical protein
MIAGNNLFSGNYLSMYLFGLFRSALIGLKVTFIWFGKHFVQMLCVGMHFSSFLYNNPFEPRRLLVAIRDIVPEWGSTPGEQPHRRPESSMAISNRLFHTSIIKNLCLKFGHSFIVVFARACGNSSLILGLEVALFHNPNYLVSKFPHCLSR